MKNVILKTLVERTASCKNENQAVGFIRLLKDANKIEGIDEKELTDNKSSFNPHIYKALLNEINPIGNLFDKFENFKEENKSVKKTIVDNKIDIDENKVNQIKKELIDFVDEKYIDKFYNQIDKELVNKFDIETGDVKKLSNKVLNEFPEWKKLKSPDPKGGDREDNKTDEEKLKSKLSDTEKKLVDEIINEEEKNILFDGFEIE